MYVLYVYIESGHLKMRGLFPKYWVPTSMYVKCEESLLASFCVWREGPLY